jgi:hypothetical protein
VDREQSGRGLAHRVVGELVGTGQVAGVDPGGGDLQVPAGICDQRPRERIVRRHPVQLSGGEQLADPLSAPAASSPALLPGLGFVTGDADS